MYFWRTFFYLLQEGIVVKGRTFFGNLETFLILDHGKISSQPFGKGFQLNSEIKGSE